MAAVTGVAAAVNGVDGWPAEKVFSTSTGRGYGFDDFVFLPPLNVAPAAAEKLGARFSRNITLQVPLVGSPGPTVTGESMAVALALAGGIGIIHRNQSVQEQATAVRRVKGYETAFILQPITLGPRNTVADAERVMAKLGCSCIPVTDNGKMGGRLLGLVTRRDLDAMAAKSPEDTSAVLTEVMVRNVVYASEPVTFREAKVVMQKHKVGKLPILNSERELVALICRGDLKRTRLHPEATRDPNSQLLVAAAVSVDEEQTGDGAGTDRARALVDAGADALLVDTDDGVTEATVAFVRRLKAMYPTTDILCGRVSSTRHAEELCKANADGLLVGPPVDPSHGAPAGAYAASMGDATLLYQIARFARMNFGVPVIAEGGVRSLADAVKALCLGASTVAPRELLARTEESPGETLCRNGVRVKLRQAPDATRRALFVTDSTEGSIIDAGSVEALVPHFLKCIRLGLQELGLKSLPDIGPSLASGALRLEVRAPRDGCGGVGLLHVERLASTPLYNRW